MRRARVATDDDVYRMRTLLRAADEKGRLIAIVANYACHCTTLGSDATRICGDWAGYAQEVIEKQHPGALCLVTIGCGADANPEPRLKLEYAKQQGQVVADEIDRLLASAPHSRGETERESLIRPVRSVEGSTPFVRDPHVP